ncbi:hypothetical protein GOP47_0002767 [Adiantum capillus-veneris]|uniref:Uncharacterized protein n=1 Tax=Adiantum capillus-veneris TaxID=13818 RepID=A0A9D4VAY8_ADICA|nr:hypothetical protein GOP47_0002767 [Adiantum capillus-veneris]
MAPTSVVPQQGENTAFIKELQWKENKSQDEFLGNLLSDDKISKDHIALKHSSSSSSGGCGASCQVTGSTAKAKAVDDPDIYTQLSINLWKRINAGYLVPRRPPTGVMRSVFTYDPSLIDHESMEFHRKRDFYSEYNEAAARFKLVHGNKKPLSKPKRVGKGGEEAMAVNGPPSAGIPGAKPLDGIATNNGDATKSNTLQIDQNTTPTTNTNPVSEPTTSTPSTTTTESKPVEPTR